MRKHPSVFLLALLTLTLFFAFSLCASAAPSNTVVYLADGGTGDGASPDSAVSTLSDAYAALDLERDCTVVVCDVFTQTAAFDFGVEYGGSVTFTSLYGGTDYRQTAGALYRFDSVGFASYGSTVFENLNFEALETGFLFVAQHHPVRIGEGCVMRGDKMTGGVVANSFAVIGGYDSSIGTQQLESTADIDISVLSGSQIYVVAYSRNIKGSYTGTARVRIGGTASLTALHGSAAYPADVCVGDFRAEIFGDASVKNIYGCTQKITQNSFTLIWKSGQINAFRWSVSDAYAPMIYAPTLLCVSDAVAETEKFAAIEANFDLVLRNADAPDNLAVFPAQPSERRAVGVRAADTAFTAYRVRKLDEQPLSAATLTVCLPFAAENPRAYRLDGSTLDKLNAAAEADAICFTLETDGLYVLSAAPILQNDADSGSIVVKRGDLNGDGKCSLFDVPIALRYLSGQTDGVDPVAVDCDGNGKTNLADVLLLLQSTLRESTTDSAYHRISVHDYMDKTTSGFLAQLVGFLSGYEFARTTDGTARIAMAEDWFEMCNGPYAEPNPRNTHTDKLLQNEETGLWEVWNDDDFSIDILNQYILRDSYRQYGTLAQKTITDGWVNYDVYDMGGGHRLFGAYGLMKAHGYLPAFAGSTEFGNFYTVNGEPYIGNETLGMDAAGMPNTAVRLAQAFGSATSDREPVVWLKYFAAMYSMAYFEDDIVTLITEAEAVLPVGCRQREIIAQCFALREKYPDNWRSAVIDAEKLCYREQYDKSDPMGENGINCAYILLGLLYGDGDYYDTCKIISLAGHGGDSTTPVALGIVGVINGMRDLPQVVNEKIWQDGDGVIVNLPLGSSIGYYMYCAGLPERFAISDIIEMYRENFEHILLEAGGYIRDGYYYIPRETLRSPDTIWVEDFEHGSAEGLTLRGNAVVCGDMPMSGQYAATVTGAPDESSVCKTVEGFEVGKTYCLTAYISVSGGAVASLFARAANATSYAQATVLNTTLNKTQRFVKRELYFTTTASSMEIGFSLPAGTSDALRASIDDITLVRADVQADSAVVEIVDPSPNGKYTGTLELAIQGGTGKETYLWLNFANPNNSVVDADIAIDGSAYAAAPFYKTGSSAQFIGNTVRIPLVLPAGASRVTLDFGARSLYIYSAQLVNPTDSATE